MRSRNASPRLVVPWALALLLGLATACEGQIGTPPPALAGAARVQVLLDPARGLPVSCKEVFFSYAARRTGDAPGAPPEAASLGDASAADTGSVTCPSPDAFDFADRFGVMQGIWEFSVTVTLDASNGPLQFVGTCAGIRIRARTVHVITVTQPPTGTTATCTFSL